MTIGEARADFLQSLNVRNGKLLVLWEVEQ